MEPMNTIQDTIITKLAHIADEKNIKMILAVESGSRAWGFASPDSDYDCRFVYAHPKEEYISLFEQKDTIDYTPDAIYDLSGWDIKKFLQHITKSNAVMLEWLQSNSIYYSNEKFVAELRKLGRAYFNPIAVSWHYLSMAKKKYDVLKENEYSKLKTYFYVLRPLACIRFIREVDDIPYMEYQRNLDEIIVPNKIRDEIAIFLEYKKESKEKQELIKNDALLNYFKNEIQEAETWLKTATFAKNRNLIPADQCFRRIIEEAWHND